MYDPHRQYRCTIIRGKSQKEMDDLLPAYAKVIEQICPCSTEEFDISFNNAFRQYLPEKQRTKKTLNNHRIEIAGKLFGMYYASVDGVIYESQRTQKYLEDNDQPAFFKDLCYKMQFPNGMDSISTLLDRIKNKINIRPNSYVLKLLQIASKANEQITVKDIAYYVLNSFDVLQGHANPYEVLEFIANDHKKGFKREVVAYDEEGKSKASSFTIQHIREQLNYLELANLIRISADKVVTLNEKESKTIELFVGKFDKKPEFNVYDYDLSLPIKRKEFALRWGYFFSTLSNEASEFETSVESLLPETKEQNDGKIFLNRQNLIEFGDAGEKIVYEYEKKRVAEYSAKLVNKVIAFGKIKGVGFDIQSIVAEKGENAEFCKYIEVKSTKRFTSPDPDDRLWIDTLNITRNEWIAAKQHCEYYSIYRLYFTKDGVVMFILNNIAEKEKNNEINVIPVTYRLDFSSKSVDFFKYLEV